MEYKEFKNVFLKKIEEINEIAQEQQIEKFYKYMKLLQEWNEKINLTAIIEDKEIITKHFIDSITINKYLKDKDNSWYSIPNNIVGVLVNPITGELADENSEKSKISPSKGEILLIR